MAAVNITHVPYKGAPQAIADVVGGHIDSAFASAAGIPVQTLLPAERAIAGTLANAPENALVVVTGSFYVICETPHILRGG